MRKIFWLILGFWLCGLLATANADTYPLTDGTSVTGDIISFNDDGVIFRLGEDRYSDRIPWTKFSQQALKMFVHDKQEPKIADYAEPFIETPPPKPSQMQVRVRSVERLELPPKQTVIGALFSSGLGVIIVLLVYAANIYAGYEIAIFRARPPGMVAGVAAALPFLGPIIFLCMSIRVEQPPEEQVIVETGAPPGAAAPGASAPGAEAQPAAGESAQVTATATAWQAAAAVPETQVFQRGQFTFNRRFFETKFSGFFGFARHGADKDMVLTVKTGRVQHVVQRVTRITATDVHFEIMVGAAHQEVTVPFGEIQEIQLKHKDA